MEDDAHLPYLNAAAIKHLEETTDAKLSMMTRLIEMAEKDQRIQWEKIDELVKKIDSLRTWQAWMMGGLATIMVALQVASLVVTR
jgi:hypothetical protein